MASANRRPTSLKPPLTAISSQKNVNQGTQLRSDNANSLFTVGQISDVWVLANVNESDIGRVKPGMTGRHANAGVPR